MSDAGWFADPTGRFGQRWYDGAAWSDNVVGANGSVITDALPETDSPLAPPSGGSRRAPEGPPPPPPAAVPVAAQPRGAPWPGPPPQYAGQHAQQPGQFGQWQPRADSVRYAPGIGLAVGIVGAILVALSLFVLKWADNDKGTFLDLSSAVRKAGSDAVNDQGIYLYCAWAGFVLFALTIIFVLLAGLPLPPSAAGNSYPRIAGAVLAGLGAVLQTVAIVHVFKGPADPQAGAWLGVAGYLVAVGGMVLGARRVAR